MTATATDKVFWREFIEIYSKYPCLWRVKSKEYSDKGKRNEAYDVLVEKLKEKDATATRDTVAKKINNLRSCYRKEIKKIEASKKSVISTNDVYTPVLWYYDLLLFLKDQEAPGSCVSSIDQNKMDVSVNEEISDISCISSNPVMNDKGIVTDGQTPDGTQISSVSEDKCCLTCGVQYATISAFTRIGNPRMNTEPLINLLSYVLKKSAADIQLFSDVVCVNCFKKFENIKELQCKVTEACRDIIKDFKKAIKLFLKSKVHTQIEEEQCLLILNDIDVKSNGSGIFTRALSLAAIKKRDKFNETKLERKHKCCVCSKAFRAYSHKVEHMVTHTKEKSFKCDTCGFLTSTKSNLNKHKQQHTQDYVCSLCNKKLSSKFSFKEHMAIHNSEKVFQCESCEKVFLRKRDKKIHEKSHHMDLGSHECKVCQRRFVIKSRLTRHMLVHCKEKKFACTTCDKKFSRKDDLKCHERIHTGDKPYSCKECGKQFRYISNCRNHMKTHTKEAKVYRCNYCNVSFLTEAKCNSHLKTRNHQKKLSETSSMDHIYCDRCKTLFTGADYTLHKQVCEKRKLKEEGKKDQLFCSACCMCFDNFDQLSEHTVQSHVDQGVLSQSNGAGVIISSVENGTDIVGLTPLDQFTVTDGNVNMMVSVDNEDSSLRIPLNLENKNSIVSSTGVSSNVLTEISSNDMITTESVVESSVDPAVSASSTVTIINPRTIFKINEWDINPYCQK